MAVTRLTGARIQRREDPRLITGHGLRGSERLIPRLLGGGVPRLDGAPQNIASLFRALDPTRRDATDQAVDGTAGFSRAALGKRRLRQ